MSEEPSFSQRAGITPIKKDMQISNMDDDLRIGLWNGLVRYYWNRYTQPNDLYSGIPIVNNFVTNLWLNYFKYRIDKMPQHWSIIIRHVENHYFNAEWNEVYDLLEFVIKNFNIGDVFKTKFTNYSNEILEKEFSAYRIVSDKITPITSKEEISEINKAISSPLQSINEHLNRALALLSDRENPDPRNSIKESISAVEAICQKITGKESATLGDALNVIRDKQQIELPPPLRDAFNKIYGYTSSSDGIRHALSEESTLNTDDARFMFISCSAFVNYLISKSVKAAIQLK